MATDCVPMSYATDRQNTTNPDHYCHQNCYQWPPHHFLTTTFQGQFWPIRASIPDVVTIVIIIVIDSTDWPPTIVVASRLRRLLVHFQASHNCRRRRLYCHVHRHRGYWSPPLGSLEMLSITRTHSSSQRSPESLFLVQFRPTLATKRKEMKKTFTCGRERISCFIIWREKFFILCVWGRKMYFITIIPTSPSMKIYLGEGVHSAKIN